MPNVGSPFRLLQELERRGREHVGAAPTAEDSREQWAGVGFRLGTTRMIARMGEVTEILPLPELSVVPRTKPWLRGLANVRGTLLPIMDLSGYLGARDSASSRNSRILVVRWGTAVAGLLVDEVLGMRHFYREDFRQADTVPGFVRPYVSGQFGHADDEQWLVFSVPALVDDPRFLDVAV